MASSSPSLNTYVQELVEGRIDFVGQALVDRIARFVLIGAAIIAFIAGFAVQSLAVTFMIYGGAVVGLVLVVLPAWPGYNQDGVKWLSSSSK